jgi:ribonuclease Z
VIIVECPGVEFVRQMMDHKLFQNYYQNERYSEILDAVIHITPHEVFMSKEYSEWIEKFASSTKHVILNENAPKENIFSSSFAQRTKLNYIHPCIFPIMNSKSSDETKLPNNCIYGQSLAQIQLRPSKKEIDFSKKIPSTHTKVLQEIKTDSKLQEMISSLHTTIPPTNTDKDGDDEVIILGTSGGGSTKYRSETCNILKLKNNGYLLFDCGEGGLHQLCQFYTKEQVEHFLKNLKCIFVSHKHADHMRGVHQILVARRELLKLGKNVRQRTNLCPQCKFSFTFKSSLERHKTIHDPEHLANLWKRDMEREKLKLKKAERSSVDSMEVESTPISENQPEQVMFECEEFELPREDELLVIGPMWCEQYLVDYAAVEDLHYCFVDADQVASSDHRLKNYFLKHLGVEFRTVQVIHSFPAYGMIVERRMSGSEWKLVFSGDTRPSEALAKEGVGANLLIHESNFDDDMCDKAISDRHSTVKEALRIGNMYHSFLRHFTCDFLCCDFLCCDLKQNFLQQKYSFENSGIIINMNLG